MGTDEETRPRDGVSADQNPDATASRSADSSLVCIILTRDEAKHIERCIRSVLPATRNIFVVDSGSTDQTRELAEGLGAKVVFNEWTNQAQQFQWALEHCPFDTEWVIRLDADEYLVPEAASEVARSVANAPADVSGFCLKRRVYFMGRWIKHGGYYPIVLLRVWRRSKGRMEIRHMDEHVVVSEGRLVTLDHDLVDENLNDLTWWSQKHVGYATREAVDLLRMRYQDARELPNTARQARAKRYLKERVYSRAPTLARSGAYFAYRFLLRGGFLDGREGAIFHTLQGFWYRFLVDCKVLEIERAARLRGVEVADILSQDYGVDVSA